MSSRSSLEGVARELGNMEAMKGDRNVSAGQRRMFTILRLLKRHAQCRTTVAGWERRG